MKVGDLVRWYEDIEGRTYYGMIVCDDVYDKYQNTFLIEILHETDIHELVEIYWFEDKFSELIWKRYIDVVSDFNPWKAKKSDYNIQMGNSFSRQVKRNKLKKAKKAMKKDIATKMSLFGHLGDECMVCSKPFDKKDKKQVN